MFQWGRAPRIIDDFANHPKELATNLETIKSIAGNGERVITLFQPQTYSRTQTRTAEFAAALKQSDMVFLLDLDPKGGNATGTPHTKHAVMDQIAKQLDTCFQFDNVQDLIQAVSEDLTPNDIVYVAGAGDIKIAAKSLNRTILRRLRSLPTPSGPITLQFLVMPWKHPILETSLRQF